MFGIGCTKITKLTTKMITPKVYVHVYKNINAPF